LCAALQAIAFVLFVKARERKNVITAGEQARLLDGFEFGMRY